MLQNHPTTGIKIVKKTGNNPTGSQQAQTIQETIIFEGQAIINDITKRSSTTITPFGMSKIDGYIIQIPEFDIPKQNYKFLEVRFCETDMHKEKDYSNENNIVLKVQDVFRPNRVFLDYITLICVL